MIIAVGNDSQFQRLCDALGLAELASDPRFANNPDRVKNRAELVEKLKAVTRSKTSRSWMAILREIKVPCGSYSEHR